MDEEEGRDQNGHIPTIVGDTKNVVPELRVVYRMVTSDDRFDGWLVGNFYHHVRKIDSLHCFSKTISPKSFQNNTPSCLLSDLHFTKEDGD